MMADVDPQLLVLSDLLVLTALERAWARVAKRAKYSCPPSQRHTQYLTTPIPEDKFEAVLRDAWVLCPLLQARYNLDVDPIAWGDTLDGYTRALFMMSERHSPGTLTKTLLTVPAALVLEDDEWDIAHGGA